MRQMIIFSAREQADGFREEKLRIRIPMEPDAHFPVPLLPILRGDAVWKRLCAGQRIICPVHWQQCWILEREAGLWIMGLSCQPRTKNIVKIENIKKYIEISFIK